MDRLVRQELDEETEKGNNVVRPLKLGSLEGISFRSVDCLERFRDSIQILKDTDPSQATSYGYDLEFSLFTMQDAFAHFKAWGNNIAAFQDGTLRSSLQFRLKEASEIQQRILKILGNLQVSLYEATLIITGLEPNEHWPIEEFSDEDEDEGLGVESEQTSELQELFKAMKDANSNLMKLSMVIRTSPRRDDYLKAATRYQFDPSYDIGHVREKHGSAKGMREWLIMRLGKAITRRRQFLKYREDHHGKLTRDWDQVEAGKEDKTIALTKATTFVETSGAVQRDGSEVEDSFGSETSYAATVAGDSAGKLNVPSHPKMAFEGVLFEFGKPFQCPYCFTEQVVKNRSAWKKHVFRDLRPYVCTFKECDMRMFRSRNEWFSHELQNHRREWVCQQCQHAPFSSSSEYEAHLRTNHHIELQESQLKALLLQSEEPVDKVAATACRLCNDWETNIGNPKHDSNRSFLHGGQLTQPYGTRNQFRRHLGRHMEQLALFALPMADDTMEDDSLSEEDEEKQATINVDTEVSMNDSIAGEVPGPAPLDETIYKRLYNKLNGPLSPQEAAESALHPFERDQGSVYPNPLYKGPDDDSKSNYWSVSEKERFPTLLRQFGTDWHAIAENIGTKTEPMIKMFYHHQVESGNHREWEKLAQEANLKRQRDEPTHLPSPAPSSPIERRLDDGESLNFPSPISATDNAQVIREGERYNQAYEANAVLVASMAGGTGPDIARNAGDEALPSDDEEEGSPTRGTEVKINEENIRQERKAHTMHGREDKPFFCTYEGCERGVAGNGFPRRWDLVDHMKRVHNDQTISNDFRSDGSASPPLLGEIPDDPDVAKEIAATSIDAKGSHIPLVNIDAKPSLSKALRKANTAVLLDNAQNYEGAIQAYSEACNLLQQVMARSSGGEDRQKLEAIRNTYTSRINELSKIAPDESDEKALPARPESILAGEDDPHGIDQKKLRP